jgi:hypothetical protein
LLVVKVGAGGTTSGQAAARRRGGEGGGVKLLKMVYYGEMPHNSLDITTDIDSVVCPIIRMMYMINCAEYKIVLKIRYHTIHLLRNILAGNHVLRDCW